jgi:hypothetical protein
LYYCNLIFANFKLFIIMKKLLFLILLGLSASAQSTWPTIQPNKLSNLLSYIGHPVSDTITNSTAEYQYGKVVGTNQAITVSVLLTKGTGTPAGTLYFQGSLDGTVWKTISSDALTNTTTQELVYNQDPVYYTYYRVYVAASGTQSTYLNTKVLVKK